MRRRYTRWLLNRLPPLGGTTSLMIQRQPAVFRQTNWQAVSGAGRLHQLRVVDARNLPSTVAIATSVRFDSTLSGSALRSRNRHRNWRLRFSMREIPLRLRRSPLQASFPWLLNCGTHGECLCKGNGCRHGKTSNIPIRHIQQYRCWAVEMASGCIQRFLRVAAIRSGALEKSLWGRRDDVLNLRPA